MSPSKTTRAVDRDHGKTKHDVDCARRMVETDNPYLCTCGLTDAEVEVARHGLSSALDAGRDSV